MSSCADGLFLDGIDLQVMVVKRTGCLGVLSDRLWMELICWRSNFIKILIGRTVSSLTFCGYTCIFDIISLLFYPHMLIGSVDLMILQHVLVVSV